MSCSCFCCRKPRYKRLVDSLFPEDPQERAPVSSEQDKLLYFAQSSPEHLDRVGEYLAQRLRRSLNRDRMGHACVALKITEKLVGECDAQRLQLIADSYLVMLHAMLESPHTEMQIMATGSFVIFAEREEDSTPYHRQYDFIIDRFTAMSLVKNTESSQFLDTRLAGLKGLKGVIRKTGKEEGPGLNIWDLDHMNKIVPAFLFNMMQYAALGPREIQPAAEADLASSSEEGLKELIVCAGLAHIDSVITPVLQHFDLNDLWTKQREFAEGVFKTLIQTMQKQDRYKAIQALVNHLDAKASESCELKQGILDTLSHCVAVAADGSLGPSVLDVFRTLVRHLRYSIETSLPTPIEVSQDGAFQDSITRTMGEFAGVLPDYHKPDIMNLINSYMPLGVPGETLQPQHPLKESESNVLTSSLVKCLKAVADTYHPSVLETTFPEALFTSLVQLLKIKEPGTQLDVVILWHHLIDHHQNKEKIPFNTTWVSLEACGLELGKVSQRFINKTRGSLYPSLYDHAQVVSTKQQNVQAFYQLLFLIALEFSHPGIMDMVQYLSGLQDLAQTTTELTAQHRLALHAVVAGVLYLIAKISAHQQLQDHVLEVVAKRQSSAPHLLPEALFGGGSDGADSPVPADLSGIDTELLFHLTEKGIVQQLPEPKHGFGPVFSREYSTSSEVVPHYSVSFDYGPESPLSNEAISFNSFKEKLEYVEAEITASMSDGPTSPQITIPTPSFDEMVGRSSMLDTGLSGLADILNSASPGTSDTAGQNGSKTKSAYDIELPSLH